MEVDKEKSTGGKGMSGKQDMNRNGNRTRTNIYYIKPSAFG